jgi:hypothetical protein
LSENSEEDAMVSQERTRQIASPNMARIENDMPILVEKRDMDTGMPKLVPVTYTGDKGEPESVGNTHTDKDTTEVARKEYRRPRK